MPTCFEHLLRVMKQFQISESQQGEYSRIRCHEIFFAVMQFARSRRSSHICPLKRQLFSQDRCITLVTRRTLLFNVARNGTSHRGSASVVWVHFKRKLLLLHAISCMFLFRERTLYSNNSSIVAYFIWQFMFIWNFLHYKYIHNIKKKKYKEKSRKCANFSRIEKIENKTCDKLEWSYEIREKEQNQTARVPAFVYISGTSSGSSSSGAKAPLTSRTIFKPGIESNAPHACTHARTHATARPA